jgi:hypothetical protein
MGMTNPGRRIEENKIQNLSDDQNLPGGKKWLNWLIEYRFVFIVIAILAQNLLYVIYISLGFSGGELFGSGTFTLMLIFCALAVSKDKRSLRVGLVWGVLSIITVWLAIFLLFWPLALIYWSFFLYTTVVIIYIVTKSKEININIIFGSIAGFLLIGVMGAVICNMLETFLPGSFILAEGMGDDRITFFYFSFITMTSLGYGDITPATDIARAISVYLVIFGQLYLAIQVAILVGKFLKRSDTKKIDKEIEDLKKEIRSLKE